VVAGTLRLLGVFMGRDLGEQYEDPAFKDAWPMIRKTVAERRAEFSTWGWKLPNTVYFLEGLVEELRNPHLVVVYRNPLDVAQSSCQWDDVESSFHRLDVPIRHYAKMHAVLGKLVPTLPCIVYSYERLVLQREAFVRSLADFCGILPTVAQFDQAVSFVDPVRMYQLVEASP